MSWTGGVISFIFLWAFCLLVVLPRGAKTQLEQGEVTPGTPPGAPASFQLGRRLIYTTIIAAAIWSAVAGAITLEWITMAHFDFLTPESIRNAAPRDD